MLKTGIGFASAALSSLDGKDVEVILLPASVPMTGEYPSGSDVLASGVSRLFLEGANTLVLLPMDSQPMILLPVARDGQIAWVRLGDPASGAAYFYGSAVLWDGLAPPDFDLAPFWLTHLDVASGDFLWVPRLTFEVPVDA